MDVQRPTQRQYPPRLVIPDDNDDSEYSSEPSDDSTIAENDSPPQSPRPRRLPAHGDERALPLYKKDVSSQEAKARRLIKKTLCIRLAASIFVVILVAVIVAAAVSRIFFDSKMRVDQSSDKTLEANSSTNTYPTSFTMYSPGNKTTSTLLDVEATPQTLQSLKTATLEDVMATATAAAYEASARMKSGVEGVRTVDCASAGLFAHAILITDTMPTAASTSRSNGRRRKRQQHSSMVGRADDDGSKMIGMSTYALGDCLLSRYACKSPVAPPKDIVFKCTVLCPGKKFETHQARHAMTDEWGACG
ncbi:hypothetical protein E4U21_004252 [Claviceps maximensis]|nr:hypothetical protein E4U21_004252 [Claviceps maximensis]